MHTGLPHSNSNYAMHKHWIYSICFVSRSAPLTFSTPPPLEIIFAFCIPFYTFFLWADVGFVGRRLKEHIFCMRNTRRNHFWFLTINWIVIWHWMDLVLLGHGLFNVNIKRHDNLDAANPWRFGKRTCSAIVYPVMFGLFVKLRSSYTKQVRANWAQCNRNGKSEVRRLAASIEKA